MKGEKKKSSKSKKEVVANETVAEEVAVESDVSVPMESSVVESSMMETETVDVDKVEDEDDVDQVGNMLKTLEEMRVFMTNYCKEQRGVLRTLGKEYNKLKSKANRKKKKSNGVNSGGLSKPQNISDDMCKFMGVPSGTQKSHNEVSKYIHNYIEEKQLKNPDNKKQILPDSKLAELLKPGKGVVVDYFKNFKSLLQPHFLKV
jgi:chromatin remodeling complex protein RSC6